MIGILYSLVPLIAWGSGDYIVNRLAKSIDSYTMNFFFSLVGWAAVLPIALVLQASAPNGHQIINFVIGSIGVNVGFLCLVRAFACGPAGIVAAVANAYAIVTTIVAWVIFGDTLSVGSIAGIGVVVSGISLISYSKSEKAETKDDKKAIIYALCALLFFGFGFTFFGEAATGEWYENSIAFQTINVVISLFIWLIFKKKAKVASLKKISRIRISYIGGSLGSLGAAGLFLALETIDTIAIPAAVGAAAPLVTALLAYKLDGEHLTIVQRFATLMIVAGIIILAVA